MEFYIGIGYHRYYIIIKQNRVVIGTVLETRLITIDFDI